jgi:deoxyribose-phosphate aldolase
MRKILPDEIKIKFSGGIRKIEQLKEIRGIADRVGTSIIPQ